MIVMHEGIDVYGSKYVGYLVKWMGTFYIVNADHAHEVLYHTLRPVINDAKSHSLEKYLGPVVGMAIVKNFNSRGIYFIEDLAGWSDDDIMRIRGVGEVYLNKIKSVIKSYCV